MTATPGTRSLRRRTAKVIVGLISAMMVISGCSIYDAPLPGGANTGDNPMKIKVMFRDVLDLVPQSTVKINDVTVGKVSEIKLKGYIAEVTVEIPGDVKLPDNARAEIRQTSLLGEKFVQLESPSEPGSGKLSNGDVIGLDRTGRNPEVEEVFGALALLLNGGGVGQLKTIFSELNNAFDGREPQLRSVLTQIRSFMGQLDTNKQSIVDVLENTNRLALELRKQEGTIKSALDDIPNALRSVNRQRDDLVRLLRSLERLSGVGVRVIRASKESTINSLQHLAPVLTGFAKAGQDFPKSFQVFLTYPFVDEAVGRNPQVARNLHMGDYTNLSVNLDIDAAALPHVIPTQVCDALGQIRKQTRANVRKAAKQVSSAPIPHNPLITPTERERLRRALVNNLIDQALTEAEKQCRAPDLEGLLSKASKLLPGLLDSLNILTPRQVQQLLNGTLGPVGGALGGLSGGSGGTGGGLGGVLPRAELGKGYQKPQPIDPFGLAALGLDPGLGTLLMQGVAEVR